MTFEASAFLELSLPMALEPEIVDLSAALSSPRHYFSPFFPVSPHERTDKNFYR